MSLSNAAKPSPFPRSTLWRTSGPSVRPITLEQAKQHLRLDPSDTIWDQEVYDALDGSIERVEHDTEKVLIFQTFELRAFGFPKEGIPLNREPVLSLSEIKYLAPDETIYTVLDSSAYLHDEARRAVFPIGEPWPAVTTDHPQAVVVTFQAGYGSSGGNPPRELIQAVLLSLEQRFYQVDTQQQYEDLIRPHRRSSYP